MRAALIVSLSLVIHGCVGEPAVPSAATPTSPGGAVRPEPVARTGSGAFVRPPGAHSSHPTVDLDALLAAFPLVQLDSAGKRIVGDVISSPADLAVLEQVRARAALDHDLGREIPVDLFLWASGAPPEPHLTKLGGVPHRERGTPWPKNSDGEPMTFVAQFCFADSREIVGGELPGDVLLLFFGEDWPWPGANDDPPGYHFEWSPVQLREPTVAADVPKPALSVPQLHGVRHRTSEYPQSFFGRDPGVFEQLGYGSGFHFAVTQSTSIGSITWFIQNEPMRFGERLIAALSSFQLDAVWPLADRKELSSPPEMMFYDVGCYYLLLDHRGRVRLAFDCY